MNAGTWLYGIGYLAMLAAGLMRTLPEPLMRLITRTAAEKYYVGE